MADSCCNLLSGGRLVDETEIFEQFDAMEEVCVALDVCLMGVVDVWLPLLIVGIVA